MFFLGGLSSLVNLKRLPSRKNRFRILGPQNENAQAGKILFGFFLGGGGN